MVPDRQAGLEKNFSPQTVKLQGKNGLFVHVAKEGRKAFGLQIDIATHSRGAIRIGAHQMRWSVWRLRWIREAAVIPDFGEGEDRDVAVIREETINTEKEIRIEWVAVII